MEHAEEITQNDHTVLLMLSGGRDSFLSAYRLLEQGWHVHMITYDNGCISNIENAKDVADRIISIYGENQAQFVGIHSIATKLYRFQETYLYKTIKDSSQDYPDLRPAQLPCLACHTGMYLESIAYCKAHGISKLAEGARKSQKFFVELPEMVERYCTLARQYGIDLMLPVYDLTCDWERKMALADGGFVPKTDEPQCWLGCPLGVELSSDEIQSLASFYDNEIAPQFPELIDAAIKKHRIARNIRAKGLQ